ncbi:hypothetical protein [Herbaspirillum sp. SJZ099]|uniref:hypothetical protein n=1 Tax=Herbaspirillum sp. SJZ099 TaxID=2572916 RepID=UPI0011A4089C|nr:hypothetical protein [Herbaspirillum sp. SJZ099]
MKPEAIKAELRRLFTEAQKLEVDLVRHQVDWATWDATKRRDGEGPPEWLINQDDALVKLT